METGLIMCLESCSSFIASVDAAVEKTGPEVAAATTEETMEQEEEPAKVVSEEQRAKSEVRGEGEKDETQREGIKKMKDSKDEVFEALMSPGGKRTLPDNAEEDTDAPALKSVKLQSSNTPWDYFNEGELPRTAGEIKLQPDTFEKAVSPEREDSADDSDIQSLSLASIDAAVEEPGPEVAAATTEETMEQEEEPAKKMTKKKKDNEDPTTKSLSKAILISCDHLKIHDAENLSTSLIQALKKLKKEKFGSCLKLVREAISGSLSADDICEIATKVDLEHPICAIMLHHVACLHRSTEIGSSEDAVTWIVDRIVDIEKVAVTAMDSGYKGDVDHFVLTICLKSMEDLLVHIRSMENVSSDLKALCEADCIVRISNVSLNATKCRGMTFDPSIVVLCEEGLTSLENQFGESASEHNSYVILFNNVGEAHMQLGQFDEAKESFEKVLRINEGTVSKGNGKILVDLETVKKNLFECEIGILSKISLNPSEGDVVVSEVLPHKKEPDSQHGHDNAEQLQSFSADSCRADTGMSAQILQKNAPGTQHGQDISTEESKLKDKLKVLSTDPLDEQNVKNSDDEAKLVDELRMILNNDTMADNKSNALIKFTEKLIQEESRLPCKIDGNLISADNCFGITVLAKQTGNEDLQRDVDCFVITNQKTIKAGESLKTLSMSNFKKYLESCDLPDTMKLDFIEAKVLMSESSGAVSNGCQHEIDLELVRLAASLSKEYRNKYLALTTYCHMALKQQLFDKNCFETAIFAAACRLDELKVWAEHHVNVNFHSILSNVKNYSQQVLSEFCEISAIPDKMQVKLIGQSESDFEKSELDETASKWLLSQLRKLSSVKTKTIGVEGGIIELDGCSITFPRGALMRDTAITMSINTDPDNSPKTGIVITPILGVQPSMSFEKPVLVKMQTCFRSYKDQIIHAQVFARHGFVWQPGHEVKLDSKYEISFPVTHFSDDDAVGVQNLGDGKCRLKNNIFIQTKTGLITSIFYSFDKDENDIKKVMRSRNSSYFSTQTLEVEGNNDDSLRLDVTLIEPDIALPHDHWRPKHITMLQALASGRRFFSADPGVIVESLSFVYGEYKVFVGSEMEEAESAWVKREWPVQLDPETDDTPTQIVAGKIATQGGIIRETNYGCLTTVVPSFLPQGGSPS